MNREKIMQTIKIVTLGLILSVGVGYALAGPTAPPPGGNIEPPINVGEDLQTKRGDLNIGYVDTSTDPDTYYGGILTVTLDVFSDRISANEFCLPGPNPTDPSDPTWCITEWPTGGGGLLLAGSTDQTIRHNGANWVVSSNLKNSGSTVTVQRPLTNLGGQLLDSPLSGGGGGGYEDPAPNADVFRALANVPIVPIESVQGSGFNYIQKGLRVLPYGGVNAEVSLTTPSVMADAVSADAVSADDLQADNISSSSFTHSSSSGLRKVCADSNGNLILCPPPSSTGPYVQTFSSWSGCTSWNPSVLSYRQYIWTIPSNTTKIDIEITGGGGGGGGGGEGFYQGEGGGGGGGGSAGEYKYSESIPLIKWSQGNNLTIKAGVAGCGGAGGDSGPKGDYSSDGSSGYFGAQSLVLNSTKNVWLAQADGGFLGGNGGSRTNNMGGSGVTGGKGGDGGTEVGGGGGGGSAIGDYLKFAGGKNGANGNAGGVGGGGGIISNGGAIGPWAQSCQDNDYKGGKGGDGGDKDENGSNGGVGRCSAGGGGGGGGGVPVEQHGNDYPNGGQGYSGGPGMVKIYYWLSGTNNY